jgi:hypothetical protein
MFTESYIGFTGKGFTLGFKLIDYSTGLFSITKLSGDFLYPFTLFSLSFAFGLRNSWVPPIEALG